MIVAVLVVVIHITVRAISGSGDEYWTVTRIAYARVIPVVVGVVGTTASVADLLQSQTIIQKKEWS
jgi:hypothetical protein